MLECVIYIMEEDCFLSIIGFGPRGLFALEQFYIAIAGLETDVLPKTRIFESNLVLGVGNAWDVTQSHANWTNISDRDLINFPSRPGFAFSHIDFPSFPSWPRCLR